MAKRTAHGIQQATQPVRLRPSTRLILTRIRLRRGCTYDAAVRYLAACEAEAKRLRREIAGGGKTS